MKDKESRTIYCPVCHRGRILNAASQTSDEGGEEKLSGYFCKVCGMRKSNESFSGRGDAAHICKACSRFSPA